MIELHGWYTQNARKVAVALEECELPWELRLVDLIRGEQHRPDYRAINPNGKIPAIVDREPGKPPVAVWESGAILIYAAEKAGRLLPRHPPERFRVLQWLMWQVSALGPTLGQMAHFLSAGLPADTPGLNSYLLHTRASAPHPYAVERFVGEARRLIGVLNEQLRGRRFVAADYSIADIAIHAWIRSAWTFLQGGGVGAIEELRPLVDWKREIDERPQVVRALRRMQEPEARSAEEVA